MHEFPANSAKARRGPDGPLPDERPNKIEQVTSAEAELMNRGLGRRFKDTFVNGNARMAFDYMVLEVVVPAIQNTLVDAFQGGVEKLIRGDSRPRRTMSSVYSERPPQVNYAGMSTNQLSPSRTLSRSSRARHDFGEIRIQHRPEAEDVLDRMYEELSRYGTVSVSVLYELTGIQSSHTDYKWGWNSLRGARVRPLRQGGYALELPDPQPLDR